MLHFAELIIKNVRLTAKLLSRIFVLLFARLFNNNPTILVEVHRAYEEACSAALRFLIGMRDEHGLAFVDESSAMAYAEVFLIGTVEIGAATPIHASALLVDKGTCDFLGTSVYGLVGGVFATATVIEAHEEVVVLSMLEDEGSLHGIGACLDDVLSLLGELNLVEGKLAVDAA